MLTVSQILVLFLMADAAWVFIGLIRKKNRWAWICLYWLVLTFKNMADFFGW